MLKFPSSSSALSPKCGSPKNSKNESPFQMHGPVGELTLSGWVSAGFLPTL